MSENISENLPPPRPGVLRKIGDIVKRRLRFSSNRNRRLAEGVGTIPDEILQNIQKQMKIDSESNTLPDLERNIQASEQFIGQLRNPSRYNQDLHQSQYMKSDLGFLVGKPVEKGWFDIGSVVSKAEERYNLPLAIYIDRNHARLLVKGPYNTPEGRKIKVFDPMISGFSEIKVNDSGDIVGLYSNSLAFEKRARNQNDLTAFLESPELAKFKNLLTDIKAFNFQRDYYNCIPYCLFVSAMLHGLEPGDTEFKREGIKQFEQDFGVRILIREEILPKPRVRLV